MSLNIWPGSARNPIVTVPVEITRPANGTPYTVNSVVDRTVAAGFVFANLVPFNGGSGRLVKWRLTTTQKANVALYRMHLYSAAPSWIADGNKYVNLYADAATRIGKIDFPAMTTDDPTGSTAAESIVTDEDFPFTCGPSSRSLYGILETLTAHTPDSQQKYLCEVVSEGH